MNRRMLFSSDVPGHRHMVMAADAGAESNRLDSHLAC